MRIRRPDFKATSSRILIGYLLVTIVLAGAWLYSLSGPLTGTVVAQQQRNLTAVARSAALVVMESDESPQRIAGQLVARTDLRLTIVAADGTVIADSDSSPGSMENHANRPEIRTALSGGTGIARRQSATEGYEQVYVAVPGSMRGQRVAVRISQSLEDVKAIASRLRRFGLSLLAVALMVTGIIAWRATRLAARPVQELAEASRQMAAGNLSVHVPEVPADLIGLAGSLTILRDQMKSRLDALDTERKTLKAALDGLAEAVLVVESGRVVLANKSVGTVLALDPAAAEGSRIDDLAIPASLKSVIRARLSAGEPSAIELEPGPTGQAWRLSFAPMHDAGGGGRLVIVLADITQRATLERVRREFVSNASHELKTPVAGIKLLADSAALAASDGDEEGAREFSRQIRGEVDRLQRLVSDLLDLSRLEALPAPGSITDMRVAIDNAVLGHGAAAQSKGLSLSVDTSDVVQHDVFVAADATDVAIALDNLLANAVHYTDTGGVTVTLSTRDDHVSVEIADTGIGIGAKHLSRVFERFYRADEGRARDFGGTGLGLSLVRHAAERNGGSVSVRSEVGIGSVFTLALPRHR